MIRRISNSMRQLWFIVGTLSLGIVMATAVIVRLSSPSLLSQVNGGTGCSVYTEYYDDGNGNITSGQPCPVGWTGPGLVFQGEGFRHFQGMCIAPNFISCSPLSPGQTCPQGVPTHNQCVEGACTCVEDPVGTNGNQSSGGNNSTPPNNPSSGTNPSSGANPSSANPSSASSGCGGTCACCLTNPSGPGCAACFSSSSIPPLQISSSNSVANSSAASQPPPGSSACSYRSQVPVVCGPAPSGCTAPADREQPACSQRCIDAELACRRNFYAQQSSWRMPAGCQYAEPSPNLYEACTRPRMECDCNCQFNVIPSLCQTGSSTSSVSKGSSVRSSVKSSAFGCPVGTQCMEETACFNAGGGMDWSNGVHESMDFCKAYAGNNWAGCCTVGGTPSSRSASSRSGSSGSENWVYTPCPSNSGGNPVLCVMGTPNQQSCPQDTVQVIGTCKNTKYENGVMVSQQVGICCGTNTSGSSRSGSQYSDGSRSSSKYSDGSRSSTSYTSDGSRSSTSQYSDGSRSSSRYSDGSRSSQSSQNSDDGSVDSYCCVAGFCGAAPGCSLTQNQCAQNCDVPPPPSSASSQANNGCLNNECENGGALFCGLELPPQTCVNTPTLPCILCVPPGASSTSATTQGSSDSSTFVTTYPPPPPCISICGNNDRECSEECDDGNLNNDDGCSNTCFLENGFCGDNVIQSRLGEECEPNLEDAGVCDPSLCRFYPSSNGTTPPRCGDGHRMGTEECDDGDFDNNDSCDNYCKLNNGRCGNGIVEQNNNEECEPSIQTGIECSQSCRYVFPELIPTIDICTGQECTLAGDAVCGYQNQSCIPDSTNLQCYRCETIPPTSSASSQPSLVCSGQECLLGGNSVCALENKICSTLKNDPCFVCTSPAAPSSLMPSSALPGFMLAFLNEACSFNSDCITGICRNNICVPCTNDNQCSSGKCMNGMCTATEVLPSQTTVPPLGGTNNNPSLVLPASTIELPFASNNQIADSRWQIDADGQQTAVNGQPVMPSAPATPDTGPAALAVMLAGAAAGYAFKRRK